MDTWKDVKDMKGRYQVNSKGQIRVLPRYIKKNGVVRLLPMQMLELTVREVRLIKKRLAEGEHPYTIAEDMGISRKVVSKIKSGRSYAWLN